MQEEEFEKVNKKKKSKIAYIFGIFMIAIYCGMGYLFAFSSLFSWQFSKPARIVLGILLMGYGIFRAFRIFKNQQNYEK